jgi:phage-related protein
MVWHVETLNPDVDAELNGLDADVRAKFVRISELIEMFGPNQVHEPHVKPVHGLGFPLWEMRMSGRSGIARAMYVTQVQSRVVVLHAFVKKTPKTPPKALRMAKKRYEILIAVNQPTIGAPHD